MMKKLLLLLACCLLTQSSCMQSSPQAGVACVECCIRDLPGDEVLLKGSNLTGEQAYRDLSKKIRGNFYIASSRVGPKVSHGSQELLSGNYNLAIMVSDPLDHVDQLVESGEIEIDFQETISHYFIKYKGLDWKLLTNFKNPNLLQCLQDELDDSNSFELAGNGEQENIHEKPTVLDFMYLILFLGNETALQDLILRKYSPETYVQEFLNLISFARHCTFFRNGPKLILQDIDHEIYQQFLLFLNEHNVLNVEQYYCAHDLISALDKFKEMSVRYHDLKKSDPWIRYGYLDILPDEYKPDRSKYSSYASCAQALKDGIEKFISDQNLLLDPEKRLTEDDMRIINPWLDTVSGMLTKDRLH